MSVLAEIRDLLRGLRGVPPFPAAAAVAAADIDLDFAREPHADELVLHGPGECDVCDLFPKRQRDRQRSRVRFTGELPNFYPYETKPCPSQTRRPLDVIEAWPGNRARR